MLVQLMEKLKLNEEVSKPLFPTEYNSIHMLNYNFLRIQRAMLVIEY